jgi:hypothetical protein
MADRTILYSLIGLYFVHWSSLELALDIGITKLSGVPASESLEKTKKLPVSRKISMLRHLAKDTDHPEQTKIISILDRLPKESIRNVIAHCYMRFGLDSVVFIQRKSKGTLLRIEMTVAELSTHLREMADLASELSAVIGETFADAEQHFAAR